MNWVSERDERTRNPKDVQQDGGVNLDGYITHHGQKQEHLVIDVEHVRIKDANGLFLDGAKN